jgi:5-methylcytosine-specific restriction endonuclease McrA
VRTLEVTVRWAAVGKREEARVLLTALREVEAREWFVEYAQVSANHRRRVLKVPRPPEVTRNRSTTPEPLKRRIWERDRHTCRYCGLPVIPPKTIAAIRALLGEDVLPWGSTNASRHGTLFLARAEYDHVVPVSLGGENNEENLVTACPSCNYGKDRWSIEELGLDGPRMRSLSETDWDGLVGVRASLCAVLGS